MKRVSFITFGCKTNHYDTDLIASACFDTGFEVVSSKDDADVYIINTCTVTASADAQARNMIRRIAKNHPSSKIIVCGCGAQVNPEQFETIGGVSYVYGIRAMEAVVKILKTWDSCLRRNDDRRPTTDDRRESRARAFLKIQDGCNNRCAYCIVPIARGASKSFPLDNLLRERDRLLQSGYHEIVLTGIHIGQYGRDLGGKYSLAKLVAVLLEGLKDCRIRISSLDPDELDDEIIALLENPMVCRHLHLSLQSGSDGVLKMMNRKTGVDKYALLIKKIVSEVSGISIGADFIAGFPGEDDKHFQDTLNFVRDVPFSYLHVFPYSARPGTKAFSMPNHVPILVRKKRANELKKISDMRRRQFYESQIGKKIKAVITSPKYDKQGLVTGVSDNYLSVLVRGDGLQYKEMVECWPRQIIEDKKGIKVWASAEMKKNT